MPYAANLISLGFCPLPNTREGMQVHEAQFFKSDQKMRWFLQMQETAQVYEVGINIKETFNPPCATFRLAIRSVEDDGTAGAVLPGVGGPAQKDFIPSAAGFQFFTLEHAVSLTWGQPICVQLEPYYAVPPDPPVSFINGMDVFPNVLGYSRLYTPYCRFEHIDNPPSVLSYPIVALRWPVGRTEKRTCGNPLLSIEPLSIPIGASRPSMRFKLPAAYGPAGATFQVAGVRMRFGWPGQTGTSMAIWKDGVAAPLQTTTNYAFEWVGGNANDQRAHGDLYFTGTLANLQYGEEYFLGFNSLASSGVAAVTVAETAHLDAYPGGREVYAAYFNETGAWVRVPTKRLFMDLILQQY